VHEAFERASLHGHGSMSVIRADGERAAAVCLACGGRLYVDWRKSPVFMEGDVFDADCASREVSEE
jgi:hypothetical protein